MANKVFISYAHESEDLSNKVLEFSNLLRNRGVDAEIDQYEESPPEGWPKWMMRQVQASDFVLVCCSELFFRRANDFSGTEEGLGVKWETSLVLQELYRLNTNNMKYIPIIFQHSDFNHIPLPLQPYTYYDLSNQDRKGKLVDRLLGISSNVRPPLSSDESVETKAEPLESKDRKSMFLSSIIDVDLWNKAKWKGMAFVSDPSLKKPPIACFVFEDEESGEKIFQKLQEQFGDLDIEEEIRLSFVENITESSSLDYKVQFGSSRDALFKKLEGYGLKPQETLLVLISRIHEMNPPQKPSSLSVFKHSYTYFKHYFITNAVTRNGQLMPNIENLIKKKAVLFRDKSDVVADEHDEDIIMFRENDEIT